MTAASRLGQCVLAWCQPILLNTYYYRYSAKIEYPDCTCYVDTYSCLTDKIASA